MASANVYRGVDMRASIGGRNVNLDTVSIDQVTDDIPGLGFEDVSPDGFVYDDGTTGVVGHTIVGKGYWDSALNPQAAGSPPQLLPGYFVGPVLIFLSKLIPLYPSTTIAGRFYGYAKCRVLGARMDGQLRGRVDFSFTMKSCGTITYPV